MPGYGAAELLPGDEVVLFLIPSDSGGASYPEWYIQENWVVDPGTAVATAQYRDKDPLPVSELLARAQSMTD
jgi:hypothetical protein